MKRAVFLLMMLIAVVLFACAAASYGDLSTDLVAHYKLDGNGNDEVGRNPLTTIVGATADTDRVCCSNGAYTFDGVDDYMQTASNLNTEDLNIGSGEDWTMSVWFSPSGISNGVLVQRYECGWYCDPIGPAGAAYYELGIIDPSTLRFILRDDEGGGYYTLDVPIDPSDLFGGGWHHMVGVIERGVDQMRLYYDGNLVATGDITGMTSFTFENNAPLFVGKYYAHFPTPYNDRLFKGKIDNIRIYSKALTDCEIAELYYKDPDLQ